VNSKGKLLKDDLPHTWPVFFARHGNFTETQRQAIPPILAGNDTLVVAPTAAGKTEAVIAPLIERFLPVRQPSPALRILYICPTRALVRDLFERLALPLSALGVSLMMKSGDTGPVPAEHPPTVLLTTPESTDSLLTRAPRLFTTLQAIVLDEIHLFDNSPRGDHIRCLLPRMERIRDYAEPGIPGAQRVALSATVPDPAGVAARYLNQAQVVIVPGGRRIVADIVPMYGLADLVAALAARPSRKSLLFCNTRNEVEQVAAYLRQHLPYEAAVFVHYSNLDSIMRREVEQGFAAASVAVCVSSSTLELGIDIGSIDDVVLMGAPPTFTSFLQRMGRGGRRTGLTQVLCLPRSTGEEARLRALLGLAEGQGRREPEPYLFRPSVLVQQTFSLLKQSPTGGVRLADLRRLAPAEIDDDTLTQILEHLAAESYLRKGRPWEWRSGPELDTLVDEHEIYSNIGGQALGATVVDAYSGRRIAQTDRPRLKGETLLMGGRAVEVAWRDKYTFGIRRGQRAAVEESLRFFTEPFAVPLEVTAAVADHLGLAPGTITTLPDDTGTWLFHWWGDLYGEMLARLLQVHFPAGDEEPQIRPHNEFCLRLPFALPALPPWDEKVARQVWRQVVPRVMPYLELGRFHELLPLPVAMRAAVAHCHLPRFEHLYRQATLTTPPSHLRDALRLLM
jgi:ATP-dependent helicase Lhr and Lhr-like helicase